MKSLNERVLANLLQEKNLALAKLSIFENSGEKVPKHFTDRLDAVNSAIALHENMIVDENENSN